MFLFSRHSQNSHQLLTAARQFQSWGPIVYAFARPAAHWKYCLEEAVKNSLSLMPYPPLPWVAAQNERLETILF